MQVQFAMLIFIQNELLFQWHSVMQSVVLNIRDHFIAIYNAWGPQFVSTWSQSRSSSRPGNFFDHSFNFCNKKQKFSLKEEKIQLITEIIFELNSLSTLFKIKRDNHE